MSQSGNKNSGTIANRDCRHGFKLPLLTLCVSCRKAEHDTRVNASGASAQDTGVLPPAQHRNSSTATLTWWQQSSSPPCTLASAKFASSRQATPLADDELRSFTPCEVVRDALPLPLANRLLKLLLADCATWTRGSWYMGGKEHAAPRTSAYYTLDSLQVQLQLL